MIIEESVALETEVCPACAATSEFVPLLGYADIPAQSCILIDELEDALAYPSGDLKLAICSSCGFVGNTLFDQNRVKYDADYEISQMQSPTFVRFARGLVRRWLDRYALAGKRVVEIGCGQGEFLDLMIELGVGSAVGFDPACRADSTDEVTLIQNEFSAEYSQVGGDFIFCRHTLEHLARPSELLREIRDFASDACNLPVCFEVPDFSRVLDETAFWDVYYEHCGYFTSDSLSRLFRAHGFQINDVSLLYGDQYLVIETLLNPKDSREADELREDETLDELLDRGLEFRRRVDAARQHWVAAIKRWRADQKTVCLWGSGSKAVGFLTGLGIDREIEFVIDINPRKQGKYMPGCRPQITGPDSLTSIRPDVVLVMNPIYTEEIRQDLAKLDLNPELVPVQALEEKADVKRVSHM